MTAKKKPERFFSNIKNILLAVALLVGFLGAFFSVYQYIDSKYAHNKRLIQVELLNDYRWETTVLNGMYARFCTLDNVIALSPDQTKIPPEVRTEYNDLKAKVQLQQDKVKELQKQVIIK